jgi:hypothetical protein
MKPGKGFMEVGTTFRDRKIATFAEIAAQHRTTEWPRRPVVATRTIWREEMTKAITTFNASLLATSTAEEATGSILSTAPGIAPSVPTSTHNERNSAMLKFPKLLTVLALAAALGPFAASARSDRTQVQNAIQQQYQVGTYGGEQPAATPTGGAPVTATPGHVYTVASTNYTSTIAVRYKN